jgi:ABC-type multidrug transport system fused ATPase/permease subunit
MNSISMSGAVLRETFGSVWAGVAGIVPLIILAAVVFLLMWVVGAGIGRLIARAITTLRLDAALRSAGFDRLLSKASIRLDSGRFIGELVKWFIVVVGFMAALQIVGLTEVNDVLKATVLLYIPKVIKAVLILLIAVVLGDVVGKTIAASAKAAHLSSANFFGTVARWVFWIFGAMAALYHLEIMASFLQTLFTGVVIALSLALGLAFGLGGRDAAASYIDKVRREISSRD